MLLVAVVFLEQRCAFECFVFVTDVLRGDVMREPQRLKHEHQH